MSPANSLERRDIKPDIDVEKRTLQLPVEAEP
jgi:hypothetical protein